MIKWVMPEYLYALILVPILFVFLLLQALKTKSKLKKLADPPMIDRLTDSYRRCLAILKSGLIVLALMFTIIALARPKWGEKLKVFEGRGIDVVIALDASKSMYAQDVKPDRLTRAKLDIKQLLDHLSSDRVAITAFAGECYVMCPLTTDVEAAKLFMEIISPDVVPVPGTNLEKAIAVSSSLLNPKEDTYKALILFTDGDNLVGDPMPAVDFAAQNGIKIFTVGVGSVEGSPVPEVDDQGNIVAYKKDRENKIVMSRLAERLLIIMAKATDGRYFRTEGYYIDRLAA
ncbi:hypothetical protein A2Y85_03120, partial [candidate division WOR-3 bacterium RBG_13_43_14]